jgi:hypothetical protein
MRDTSNLLKEVKLCIFINCIQKINNNKKVKKNLGANVQQELVGVKTIHCKKRILFFPSPAGMSLTKLTLAGNY